MTDLRPRLWLARPAVCLLVLGTACAPARVRTDSGVAVGNPGSIRLALAPGEAVAFDSARATVAAFSMLECGGGWHIIASDTTLVLDPTQPLQIPSRSWCGAAFDDMTLQTDIVVEGSRSEAPPLRVWNIELWGDKGAVPGTDLALWLGMPGWIDVDGAEDWLGTEADPVLDDLAEDLAEESVLVVDALSDGPDEDDVEVAWADADDFEDAEVSDSDEPVLDREAGCGNEEETVQAFVLLALGLAGVGRRRRRRHAIDQNAV